MGTSGLVLILVSLVGLVTVSRKMMWMKFMTRLQN
ncbi:hypothetical protein GLYMA_04G144751v4 [Glycine max]|nr:hypothetical protein GLYMA_04G144751v4 [Glycine max]KAH1111360.1 hypothetical protein GYH30_009935 [Glycine max]